MKNEIHVDFINKDNGAKEGLIFYSYESFGEWCVDNFDAIKNLEIKKIKKEDR